MQAKKAHPYYKYNRVCSYNGTYNFVVGGRGLGKTYGAKLKAIRNAVRKGEMFIYLRRYKSELNSRHTFFADIDTTKYFPNWDFRIQGLTAEMAHISTREDRKREWTVIGYFIALSTSQSQKSIAFPRVTTIIFDEFIIEKGAIHYLPDEAKTFTNFYSTVDRYQDKTTVFFLANSVSINNPYFLEYGIEPKPNEEIIVAYDGFVVCHFPDAKDFASSVFQTKFGRFIQNTEYADYAVGNEFADNSDSMIGAKSSDARYRFTLETKNGKFSVWHDMNTNEYTVQSKLPKEQRHFTLVHEKMDADKILMNYNDKTMQIMRGAFNTGRVIFDKPATRNTFIEIFKR